MKKLKVDLTIGVKELEIFTRNLINKKFMQQYMRIVKGKGLEFEEYRTYSSDDDASLIDWKASRRSNQLLMKAYKQELDMNVFFLIDISNSMLLTSFHKLKVEYVAELVASLAYPMLKGGNKLGFALFNENIQQNSPVTKDFKQFFILSEALVNPKTYGGDYDLGKAIRFLLSSMKETGLVFIVSDFIGILPGWEKDLRIASKKFEIVGIMVRDIRDRTLPRGMGQIALGDPYSEARILVEPNEVKTQYAAEVKKEEKAIAKEFIKSGAEFVNLQTNQSFVGPLVNFFRRQQAKWR